MSVEWKARSKAPDAKATGIAKAPVPQRQNRRPDRYGKGRRHLRRTVGRVGQGAAQLGQVVLEAIHLVGMQHPLNPPDHVLVQDLHLGLQRGRQLLPVPQVIHQDAMDLLALVRVQAEMMGKPVLQDVRHLGRAALQRKDLVPKIERRAQPAGNAAEHKDQ